MQTGIIGLADVGKTTLFKIPTHAQLDEKAARAATHVGVALVLEPKPGGAAVGTGA
jgi:hypothetical protein